MDAVFVPDERTRIPESFKSKQERSVSTTQIQNHSLFR